MKEKNSCRLFLKNISAGGVAATFFPSNVVSSIKEKEGPVIKTANQNNHTKRQYNSAYSGEYLNRIAFPIGGLGAGMFCMGALVPSHTCLYVTSRKFLMSLICLQPYQLKEWKIALNCWKALYLSGKNLVYGALAMVWEMKVACYYAPGPRGKDLPYRSFIAMKFGQELSIRLPLTNAEIGMMVAYAIHLMNTNGAIGMPVRYQAIATCKVLPELDMMLLKKIFS